MPIPVKRCVPCQAIVLGLLLSPLTAVLAISGASADEPRILEALSELNYFERFWGQQPSLLGGAIKPAPEIRALILQDAGHAVNFAEEVEIQETDQVSERTKSRMQILQRPLGEIKFEREQENVPIPSTTVLSSAPPLYITYSAHPARSRNRNAIAAKHNPLYFEEPNLERCGNTLGCAQPFLSACHFFGNALALPYRIAERPWCTVECDRIDCPADGRLSCTEPLRPSVKGMAFQTAVLTGLTFLLM